MKKHFCFNVLIFILFLSTPIYALNWTIRGNSYVVDTLFHNQIGPGTTQTSLALTGTSKLRVYYITTDLTNQYVQVHGIMANDKIYASQPVSTMAKEHSTNQISYFAGVNADFFNMGGTKEPIGTTIIDGEYYFNNSTGWQAFAIDDKKVPYLANSPVMTCTIDGKTFSMNTTRAANSLVLYSQRFGTTTGTDNTGSEVVVYTSNNSKLMAGRTVTLIVGGTPTTDLGNSTIPKDKFILSGQGTMATYVKSLTAGKQLTMTISLTMDGVKVNNAMQCLGGCPLIVSKGKVLDTDGVLDHLTSNNPRTAIGYNASKTKLVMLVVDGRSSLSVGVVSKALADIMLQVGCTEAMNFDGGGSSTIYSKDFGVLNTPSGGSERSVTNGIYVTTSVPTDNTIASVRFAELKKTVPQYTSYIPVFYAYNKYGVLISKDFKGAQLSCPSQYGKILDNGTTLLCTNVGTFLLTATYGNYTTTIPITSITSKPSIFASKITDDGYHGYHVNISVRANQKSYSGYNQSFSWKSNDKNIATVDSTGFILGVHDGETIVSASNSDFKDSLIVVIQKPTVHALKLDTTFNISKWNISAISLNSPEIFSNEKELTLSGTASATTSSSFLISKTIPIWSIPDSIRVSFNPGDTPINSITFSGQSNSKTFTGNKTVISLKPNQINTISIPLSNWFDVTDRTIFPISFSSLRFYLGSTTVNSVYQIKLLSLETIYNAIPEEDLTNIQSDHHNYENYQPIFINGKWSLSIPSDEKVNLKLYNLSGQLLVSQTDFTSQSIIPLQNLQKGIYMIIVSNQLFSKQYKIIVK
jgi:exopolysaccharide biosynthesis protein